MTPNKNTETIMLKHHTRVGLGILMAMSAAGTQLHAEEAESNLPPAPDYRPFTLGLEAGTTGVGGSAHWRFLNHFGIGGGFNWLNFSMPELEGDNVRIEVDLKFQVAPLTLDYYPFKKRSFRISAGMAYNGNEFSGSSTYTEETVIGDNSYSPEDIGTLTLDAKLGNQFVPYVGIGGVMFYFDKAHRWSLGWELGVLFTGSPEVSLKSSNTVAGLAEDLEREQRSIEDDLSGFRFYPVAKIALSYSF